MPAKLLTHDEQAAPALKCCKQCNRFFPPAEFQKNKTRPGGVTRLCIACWRVYRAEHRRLNHDAYIARERAKRAAQKAADPDYFRKATRESRKKHRASRMLDWIKRRAKRKGIAFTLTLDRVRSAIESGVCEVTGIKFDLESYGPKKRSPWAPSVDRINPELGYTDDNVRVVVTIYNLAKSNFKADDLSRLARAIVGSEAS